MERKHGGNFRKDRGGVTRRVYVWEGVCLRYVIL
jgi:hypothetical protein